MFKEGVTIPESKQTSGNQAATPAEPVAPKELTADQNDDQTAAQNQNDTLDPNTSDLPPDVQSQINDIGDRVNEQVAGAAANVSRRGAASNAETGEDPFFDTLPLTKTKATAEGAAAGNADAKGAAKDAAAGNSDTNAAPKNGAAGNAGTTTAPENKATENTDTNASENASGNADIKAKIETLRGGNLYQAVIAARLLQKNKKNPMASSAAARFSRFLDSSALDTAADLNAIAGNGIGLLTTFDTDPTSKTVFQGMSLVSNLLTIVTTCRSMTGKIRKLSDFSEKHKAGEKVSKIDTALTLLSIASDMLTMMVKGVSIIKTIMSMMGKNNRIMNMISNAMFLLTGATQIIGALNDIRGLQTGYASLKSLKEQTETPRKEAMDVIERKKKLEKGKTSSWSESECIKTAKEILSDKHLSEEDKDKLILYLGLTKRVTKAERSLAVTTASLINYTIGFFSTGVSGANTVVNGRGQKNKTLKDASAGMGAVSNVSAMINASAKVANRAVDAAGGGSKNFVKQSLWDKVKALTQNHRGLKWLDESLAKPPDARPKVGDKTVEAAAEDTYNLYQKADSQFHILGVPYAKLIRAGSLSKFKDMLVEGL